MHIFAVIIAALAAFSAPQAEANPLSTSTKVTCLTTSAADSATAQATQNLGFRVDQQEHGQRLKNGPIAIGNVYKRVRRRMPPKVDQAFSVAIQSQVPVLLNKNRKRQAAATTTTVASKPKSTTSSSVRASSTSSVRTSSTSSIRASSTSSIRASSTSSVRTSSTSSVRTSSTSSVRTSSTSSIGAVTAVAQPVNQFDTAYMISLKVGGQMVIVDVDTGSSDLWVFSNLQPSSQTSGHNVYSPNQANLMKNYNWNVTYFDGSTVSGLVYNDAVGLGNVNFPGQVVEAAQTASEEFSQAAYDGLLGLAFDSINTVRPRQQKTLFDSIKSQLGKPVFTSDLKHNAPGSFDFGYVNASKYTGTLTYANVDTSNGWWQFSAGGYSIGSSAAVQQTFDAIVDTGTTLMVLPTNIVSLYYSKVTGASYSDAYGAWIYPCASSMPALNLIVNGAAQTVPGSFMDYGPIDYNGNCYGGLQPNENIGFAILGTIFLKSQFVVYDQSTSPPRLGFARQVGLSYA